MKTFTPEQLEMVKKASPEKQAAVQTLLKQNLPPEELVSAVSGVMGFEKALPTPTPEAPTPPPHAEPVGNDIMVATPTGQGLSYQMNIAQQQAGNSQTTINEQDIALLQSRVESVVKQMIASGASDDDIQKAVADIGSTPELDAIAREMAQQQLDAEKFNLFNTRNSAGQGEDTGAMLSTVGAAMGLGAASQQAPAAPEEKSPLSLDYKDMGPTTLALAMAGPGGFTPGPNLPARGPSLGQGAVLG